MKTMIKLDTVLDLVMEHRVALAEEIDCHMASTTAYRALWEEYKRVSELYDDIRRAANDD